MTMLDIHTREKINKMHIAEMHRDACTYRLLRELQSERILVVSRDKIRLVLIAVLLGFLVSAFVISATVSF